MQFVFQVDGAPVEFTHDKMTGRAQLAVDGLTLDLQTPYQLGTHFEFSLTKDWSQQVRGHEVIIQKIRPLFLPWARPNTYRVWVDGTFVTEATGS